MNSKYSLNVISRLPDFNGKAMKQHLVNGSPHIGVWGDEPFGIRFKNNSSQKVQVRLSLDGTDVLTTEAATVSALGKMWVVGPWDTLELDAWPETNEKGARFVFSSTSNSVALHTHGDMSNKGTVAAAVFIEGYIPPTYDRLTFNAGDVTKGGPIRRALGGATKGIEACYDSDLYSCSEVMTAAAVGAGETINQKIGTAAGLTKPVLAEVLTLQYLWWDQLKEKLAAQRDATPTGFKDYKKEYKIADLSGVPRVGDTMQESLAVLRF